MKLTGDGSRIIASAVFQRAEIALFDQGERVTPWQPYDIEANTPVTAPRRLDDAELALRTPDEGTWLSVPARTRVEKGDTLTLPPPSEWFVSGT